MTTAAAAALESIDVVPRERPVEERLKSRPE
jgi:hypothetical protein